MFGGFTTNMMKKRLEIPDKRPLADLIDCDFQGLASGLYLLKYARLTWQGHDFLSKIKNETVWQKTKATFKDKFTTIPFNLLSDIALEFCKKTIEV